MIGAILIVSFLVLLILGAPISMGMGISTTIGLVLGKYDLTTLPMLPRRVPTAIRSSPSRISSWGPI